MRTFAIIVMLLGMPLLSRAQTAQNSWGALNSLHAGQRIEIVETHLKKHNGMFSTVTDEAIRGIAAISSNFQRNAVEVLCIADWLAERAVWSELVSAEFPA